MGMTDAQFKAFLREQLWIQKDLQKAIEAGDMEKAKEIVDDIVKRTEENIDDL